MEWVFPFLRKGPTFAQQWGTLLNLIHLHFSLAKNMVNTRRGRCWLERKRLRHCK
jgi:hypothetical protein